MLEFKNYHPVVSFVYFAAVIGFSMFFLHPFCILISLTLSLVLLGVLKGAEEILKSLVWIFAVMVVGAVSNSLFNHQGVTVIAYLPSGNPLTLESIIYGMAAGCMIGYIVCWFSCLNVIFTSEKVMYLFGRILPTFALIFSMTLRLTERFKRQLGDVSAVQKGIGPKTSESSKIRKLKSAMTVFSVVISGMMEDSLETANSMRARGYGLKGRTAFSIFKFEKRDGIMLLIIAALSIFVWVGAIIGTFEFECFPAVRIEKLTFDRLWVYGAYILLFAIPIFAGLRSELKWKFLK